ncbi:MAG: hypothetical protein RL308_876 [Bacteroidota bacterium]|jgi:hypothetical protein
MKNFTFTLFFLFVVNSYSQEKYEYFGALKLNGNDKTVITYRLMFYENKGKLDGYSITDIGGPHETKNTISGSYNSKTKEINFKEESILYTKSPITSSMFCFVNYSGKIKLVNDNSKLTGDFKGLYQNKKKCIDGTLTLIGSNKLYSLLNKVNNRLQKSKKVDENVKQKANPISILDSLKVNNLSRGQNLNVFTKFNTLDLIVWDSKVEDGDKINLYNNDVLILKEYVLVNKKKKITVNVDKGNNVFRIEAVNQGELQLNTASIQLTDQERTFDLISNLKKGESASITIIKQEE